MANVRISDLTSAAAALSTQQIEVNESGTSKKITNSQLLSYIEGEISTSPTFTGQVSIDDGTAVAPTLTNTGDTNTGIYFPAADTISFSTGGTLRGTFDSSGNFVTTGTIELGNASDTTISRVSAGVASIEGKNIALNGTGEVLTTGTIELGHATDTTLTRVSAGVIAVEGGVIPKENRANTFTVQQEISTGASQSVLALAANAAVAKTIQFITGTFSRWVVSSDNSAESGSNAGSNFIINRYNDAGAYLDTALTINRSSGNVGIGAASPNEKFHIRSAGSVYARIQCDNAAAGAGLYFTNTTTNWLIGAGPVSGGGEFAFHDSTRNAERMRITINGGVAFGGATNYGTSGQVLQSNGDAPPSWTAPTTVTTSNVLSATAGGTTAAVGTYAFLRFEALTAASAGTNHAGSGLRYSNGNGGGTGVLVGGGTWKLMGETGAGSNAASASLFLRIA